MEKLLFKRCRCEARLGRSSNELQDTSFKDSHHISFESTILPFIFHHTFIRITFIAFQSKYNLLLRKNGHWYCHSMFWCQNSKIWKFQLYSNTFFDIFLRRRWHKVVLYAKVSSEETNDTITIRSPSGDINIVTPVILLFSNFRWWSCKKIERSLR